MSTDPKADKLVDFYRASTPEHMQTYLDEIARDLGAALGEDPARWAGAEAMLVTCSQITTAALDAGLEDWKMKMLLSSFVAAILDTPGMRALRAEPQRKEPNDNPT